MFSSQSLILAHHFQFFGVYSCQAHFHFCLFKPKCFDGLRTLFWASYSCWAFKRHARRKPIPILQPQTQPP